MNSLLKWILSAFVIFSLFKFRYKVLNFLLGSYWLRKLAVRGAMSIPGLRSKFISSAFR